jgi:NitT/TauT family transport system ATP-binding protein
MSLLEVRGLGHTFRGGHHAVADLSFAVDAGELVCVVGPSGCGKSTLLRAVGGLLAPERGEVRLHGEPVRGVPADLAIVFQDYSRSLFPWLSTRRNVEFPLRWRGFGRAARREPATQALQRVGLSDVGDRYPWQLSGGMQQRAAIAHDIDESVYPGDRVLVLSPSPARIVADLAVGLPADRDQITTRESPEFVALRGEVARLLRAGVRSPR